MTPREILALIREKEVKAVDLRFMDFPGLWQHFTIPAETPRRGTSSRTASASTAPASAAGRRSTSPTCSSCRVPDTAFIDPFCNDTTLTMICNIQDPLTKEDYTRDPRNVARKAVNYMKSTGIADTAYFGPELRVLRLRRRALRPDAYTRPTTTSTSAEGAWNTGRDEKPNLGYKLRYKEGYFPCPPSDALHDLRIGDDADDDRVRPEGRGPPPRGGHRRAGRDRHALRRPGPDGRQRAEVQVHRQERRPQARQDGHVHAQAAVRGQRQRHARPRRRSGRTATNLFAGSAATPACPTSADVRHRRPA